MVKLCSGIRLSDYIAYVYTSLQKKKIVIFFFAVCASAVGFLVGQLIYRVAINEEITLFKAIPLIVVVALIIFYFSLFFGMCFAQYRKGKQAFSEESDYTFLNNKFVISRAGTEGGYDVFYNTIVEIIEKRKRIFFYLGPQRSFMVRKDHFLSGDINSLRELLVKHCVSSKLKLRK